MKPDPSPEQFISSHGWEGVLRSLSDVLQLGLSVVHRSGGFVIVPQKDGSGWRFGTRFLWETFRLQETASSSREKAAWVDCLEPVEFYFELKDPLGLRVCLLPLEAGGGAAPTSGCPHYLVVGPVILPPRWTIEDYQNMLATLSLPLDLMDDLLKVRMIAAWHLRSVMELLRVIQRDMIVPSGGTTTASRHVHATGIHGETRDGGRSTEGDVPFAALTDSLRSQISVDDFLLHVMDLLIGISKAQRGSIMLYDAQKAQLELRAAKGFALKQTKPLVRSLDEGLAGYTLKRKKPLLIEHATHSRLVKQLGHTPDIQQALILPLFTPDKGEPLGVINLAVHERGPSLKDQRKILIQLSRLTALFLTYLKGWKQP